MTLNRNARPLATMILPIFNAVSFLEESLEETYRWLAARQEDWELILVDDASCDGTADLIDRFVKAHEEEAVLLVRFKKNRGKGFAVRAGLERAGGEFAVFMDCDQAYPVENTARIVGRLQAGADAAVACRVLRESTYLISPSFFSYLYSRHLLGRIFNTICRLLALPGIRDTQAGLKGFRTAAIRPILPQLVLDRFSFDVELLRALMDRGTAIEEIPVIFRYNSEPTTVQFIIDSMRMIRDLVRVRLRSMLGRYRCSEEPYKVIINADDFGISPAVNRTIEKALATGVVSRASIMLGTPHAGEVLAWASEHREFSYGVHLNLTLGRPVLPPLRVPSLVDRYGGFHSHSRFLCRLLTGRINLEEVRREWEAQILRVRIAGIKPEHLDSHHHVHLLPTIFRKVTLGLIRDLQLPIRYMDGPVRGLTSLLLRLACPAGRRPSSSPIGFGTSFRQDQTFSSLRSCMSRLRPGNLYELPVHPGQVDRALMSTGDNYLDGRRREWELLSSEEARIVLSEQPGPFMNEEGPLDLDAATVPGQAAIGTYYPVARYDDRNRIGAVGGAYGPDGVGPVDSSSQFAVAYGVAERNFR